MFDVIYLIVAFAGGIFGAALGGLPVLFCAAWPLLLARL